MGLRIKQRAWCTLCGTPVLLMPTDIKGFVCKVCLTSIAYERDFQFRVEQAKKHLKKN